jgi:hypothetical protein
MNQAKVNYWIDVGIGVSFIIAFVTGIVKWPGFMVKLGINYASLPISKLSTLHDWSGLAMGFFALLHIILHWKWICWMTKSFFKIKKTDEEEEGEK